MARGERLINNLLGDKTGLKVIILVLVALLGLEMRFTALRLSEVNGPLRADALDYFSYAYNLVDSGIYSRTVPAEGVDAASLEADFVRSPGFPLFATLFFSEDIGEFLQDTLSAQLWLNSLVILAVMVLGCLYFSYWPVLAVSLLYATSPHIINMNLYFLSESLMVSLVVLLVALLCRISRGGGWITWALCGLVLAYASLTRPYLKYFVLLLVPYLVWACNGKALRKSLVLLAAYCLIAGPWSLYVALKGGQGTDVLMVGTIHHGLYPDIQYNGDPSTTGYPYRFDPNSAEISASMDSVMEELARRFETEPLRHLQWYLIGKPLTLWQWSLIQGSREVYVYPVTTPPWDYLGHFQLSYVLQEFLHYPLVFCAFLFSIAVWIPAFANRFLSDADKVFFRGLSLLLIYGTAIHMVGAPFPRYQIPQKFPMFIMGLGFIACVIPCLYRGVIARIGWGRRATVQS